MDLIGMLSQPRKISLCYFVIEKPYTDRSTATVVGAAFGYKFVPDYPMDIVSK